MATTSLELPYKPLFLQAASDSTTPVTYTAADVRRLIGAVFPRTGVLGGGAAPMRIMPNANGANNSIDITSGIAILGDSSSGFDRYLCYLPSRQNIPLTGFNTAPSATRTHAVYICVYDGQLTSSTDFTAKIVVTEDTGSGAPQPSGPDPAFYMQLGTFTLGPSQNTVGPNNVNTTIRRAGYGSSNLSLPLATNIISATSSFDGGPPTYAVSGSRLAFAGIIMRSSGTFEPADANDTTGVVTSYPYTIATLPEGFRPRYNRYAVATGEGGHLWRCSIFTTGAMVATLPLRVSDLGPGRTMTWLALDGIEIELD